MIQQVHQGKRAQHVIKPAFAVAVDGAPSCQAVLDPAGLLLWEAHQGLQAQTRNNDAPIQNWQVQQK